MSQTVDLLITGAQALDVFSGELIAEPLAVAGGRVVGFGDYPAREVLDLSGRILLPGFCDGHLHLESSLLTVPQFAAAAVVHGTTGVVADPHEIANVCGTEGVRYLLDTAPEGLLDCFFTAPSCVPATRFETAGAELDAEGVAALLRWPQVLGLGEVMNYPGVLAGDRELLRKIAAAHGQARKVVDGHAPGLSGRELMAYLAAGPDSDHECTTLAEAREKLALGMWVMVREGSASRNLQALAPLLQGEGRHRCLLVSDDLEAADLLQRGHLDHLLRSAVALGVAPLAAVRAVSLNVAQRFGLRREGALAPGYGASVVAVDDLEQFRVDCVLYRGRVVVRGGQLSVPVAAAPAALTDTCRLPALDARSLRVPAGGAVARARLIVAGESSLLTGSEVVDLPVRDGDVQPDVAQDALRLAVVERHGRSGKVGLGFVRGFGLREGALASTVAHDSHNLLLLGCDEQSMLTAARAVAEVGGGQAVARGTEVLARLPLPVAGLLSDRPAAEVAAATETLRQAAAALGCRLRQPFMALSFLALPVIPELKLTDRGLFDVSRFEHVPVLVSP